ENVEPLRLSKLKQTKIGPTRLVESFPPALPDHRVFLALSPFVFWRRALSQKISQNTHSNAVTQHMMQGPFHSLFRSLYTALTTNQNTRSHAVTQHMMQGPFHSLFRSLHTALTANRWEYRLRPSSHRQGEARAHMQHPPLHRQGEARAHMQPARPNRGGASLWMPDFVARAHVSRGTIYGGARDQAYVTTLPQPPGLLLPMVQPSRTRLWLFPSA